MSELYLVRHGQASFGAANYDQLSPLGFTQGHLLGEYFREREINFDRVICGGMQRHQQTLAAISEGMGHIDCPTEQHIGWNEFQFQQLATAFLAKNPHMQPAPDAPKRAFLDILKLSLQAWSKNELPNHELDESWQAFESRVAISLAHIAAEPDKAKVLVVSSGGAISMALRQILKADAETMISLNLQTANTSVSRCYFNQQGFSLQSFNHLPHLHAAERGQHISYF